MKKQMVTSAMILGVMMVLCAGLAFGQFINSLRVDVPFNFYVGEKLMPAGEYMVSMNDPGSGFMTITGLNNKSSAFFLTYGKLSKNMYGPSKLIFNRYGNTAFLSQVVENGERDAAALLPSNAEKQLRLSGEEEARV